MTQQARGAAAARMPVVSPCSWLLSWAALDVTAGPEVDLVCFPHAGGGAGAFRSWVPVVPGHVRLSAVRPPGRESRLHEGPLTDLRALAARAADAVAPTSERPYVLLGHSLGALVAYETALALLDAGRRPPDAVVVVGLAAPHLAVPSRPAHDLPEPDFLRLLGSFGGMPPTVLADRELLSLLLPTLRADFALLDTYRPRASPRRLPVPLVALRSAADTVSGPALQPWSECTSAGAAVGELPGGHFGLLEHPREAFATVDGLLSGLGVRVLGSTRPSAGRRA